MELPDSIKAIGEQLGSGGEVTPAPELFDAYDVFAAEVAQIFTRPWLAVDHASRLTADGDFLRAEIGSRSLVVVRQEEGKIYALRNACLHAGYRVCEEESGNADHLFCVYHGWSYALDGTLTDPYLRPTMNDRTRFRLARYAMQIERGLILVDPSSVGQEAPEAGPIDLGALPLDLADRVVSHRAHHKTTSNWKRLRQLLWNAPGLALGGECDEVVELGPLSFVALRDGDAALLRLIPRYPGHTEIQVVQMAGTGKAPNGETRDAIGEALQQQSADSSDAVALDRGFYDWYWQLMAPPAEAAGNPA